MSNSLMLLLLSRFRLCTTPQTAAHQTPPSLGFPRQEHWSGLPPPSPMQEREKWKWSHSVVSDSLWSHGLQPTRLLRLWDFSGKSTGVRCHCLLQQLTNTLRQITQITQSCEFQWNIIKNNKDQELTPSCLNDPGNQDGMVTQPEPDILECEVKWALWSITTNKASGGDRIPAEYFKSSKMMLWKCCTQYANKFGKLSSGHRPGKGQFSFQSQRKAIPKNAQITARLHSSPMLVK